MSDLVSTPQNPTILPPVQEVLSPEEFNVRTHDDAIERASKAYRMSTMMIAWHGHRMKMNDGWTQLGFEPGPRGEEAYRKAKNIPKSTWYKALRIGMAFNNLSLPELERIPISTAEILLAVNPLIMADFDWVRESRQLPEEELASLVITRNRAIGDDREPLQALIFRVPYLAHDSINAMLESFKTRHELSSKSQALEMLVADRHDQENLIASTDQAIRLIEASLTVLRNNRRIQGTEADEWLELAMEVLSAAYEKTVQGSRQGHAQGVQNNGGRS